jgi:hypothetical protein
MRKRHVGQIFKGDRYEQLSIEALHAVFKRFEAGVIMNKNYIYVCLSVAQMGSKAN